MSSRFEALQSLSDAIVGVAEKVSPSVVRVSAGRRSFGSGVVWDRDGHIVTNHHVVGSGRGVEVGTSSGTAFGAKVVGADPYTDLALLKVEAGEEKLQAIELGDSDQLRVGEFVLALANPFGEQPAVVSGIVTSPRKDIDGWYGKLMENMIISDAPVNPGYSGGPLVVANGSMVGINTAYANSRALSIPTNTAKQVVERLSRDGRIRTGYLGVVLNAIRLPDEMVEELDQRFGLMVLSVSRNTPAREAGLAIGDVLLRFNEKPVQSHYELRKFLSEDVIGKPVKISVLRGSRIFDITVIPADEAHQAR
ncbi:MAG: trypsin-like peptidase domain-containing protein [Nitrososphaerota archaeon]|nr:trypsin-like peptidase domain-containing protein [Nitrososphaerota archaeon]